MYLVGIDENGLGPRLGPLVTTAVTLEVERYQAARLRRLGRRVGIFDSKESSGFGKMGDAESVALALVERVYAARPRDADELFAHLAIDGLQRLRAPCPGRSRPQCWSEPVRLPAFGGDIVQGRAALARLSDAGVGFVRARSAIACARVVNRETARLGSRFALDLVLFERLLLETRAALDAPLVALCGMVGGIRNYQGHFRSFSPEQVALLRRRRGSIRYDVQPVGEVTFEIDADASHLPVGLASMVGKYLRELAMERQNRFYLRRQDSLRAASGYHDPVTTRFIADTRPLRRRLGIAPRCFER